MSTNDRASAEEVWPPAPGPQNPAPNAAETVVTHCPACSRKLLTQTSALCNWCGAKINDPSYQEKAAQTRQMRDESERKQIEEVVQEEARYGVYGRLKRRAKQNPGGAPPLG